MAARKSVLTIGLDPTLIDFSAPEYAAFPGLDAAKVLAAVEADADRLRSLGCDPTVCMTDFGETAPTVVLEQLRQQRFDIVLIGAGVWMVGKHTLLFEQLINLVHEHAPQARLCFNSSPADTAAAVQRWL